MRARCNVAFKYTSLSLDVLLTHDSQTSHSAQELRTNVLSSLSGVCWSGDQIKPSSDLGQGGSQEVQGPRTDPLWAEKDSLSPP